MGTGRRGASGAGLQNFEQVGAQTVSLGVGGLLHGHPHAVAGDGQRHEKLGVFEAGDAVAAGADLGDGHLGDPGGNTGSGAGFAAAGGRAVFGGGSFHAVTLRTAIMPVS